MLLAKEDLVVSGLDVAALVFDAVDPRSRLGAGVAEGERARPGDVLGRVEGPARGLLQAERVALNFLQRLCGVATLTRRFVDAVAGTRARIRDTRKTTPLLRALEKRAVVAGGGVPHRAGLDDAILVKDNHVRLAGSVGEATRRAVAAAGGLPVEMEVERLEQIEEALAAGATMLLLDNFTPEDVRGGGGRIGGPRARGGLGRRQPGHRARLRGGGRRLHRGGGPDPLRAGGRHLAGDRARCRERVTRARRARSPARPARGWRRAPGRRRSSTRRARLDQRPAQGAGARGAAGVAVVLADAQTAGRGRQGGRWASPPGNLYLSVLLRPARRPRGPRARCRGAWPSREAARALGVDGAAQVAERRAGGRSASSAGILAEASSGAGRARVGGPGHRRERRPASARLPPDGRHDACARRVGRAVTAPSRWRPRSWRELTLWYHALARGTGARSSCAAWRERVGAVVGAPRRGASGGRPGDRGIAARHRRRAARCCWSWPTATRRRVISGEVARAARGGRRALNARSDEPAPHHRRRQHQHGARRPRRRRRSRRTGASPPGASRPRTSTASWCATSSPPPASTPGRSRGWPRERGAAPDPGARRPAGTYLGHEPLVIEPGVQTGMPILYEPPGDVGADRIVNGVAAFAAYGGPGDRGGLRHRHHLRRGHEEGRVRRGRDLSRGRDQRGRALPARGAPAAGGHPQPGARDRPLDRRLHPVRASTSATRRWCEGIIGRIRAELGEPRAGGGDGRPRRDRWPPTFPPSRPWTPC